MPKRGQWRREVEPSETSSYSTDIHRHGSQSLKTSQKVPFLNPDPLTQWSRPNNIARVKIDGESSWALLDSGLTIKAVTPGFVEACSLDIGLLSDLMDGMGINGFGGVFSWPLGYIIRRVQVEGVWGYDEDEVALFVPDSTIFGSQVLVTLGTPTINGIINVIKESEINELSTSLNGSRMAQLLACRWAELSIKEEATTQQTVEQTNLKEIVKMTKREEVDTFSSKVIHSQMKTMLLRNNMNVMTQALKGGDGPYLPHGLSVVNTYTQVISGSKWVAVVVKNLMAIPVTITKGIKIALVVVAHAVPPLELVPGTLEVLDEVQGIQCTKMLKGRKKCSFSN